MQHHLHIALTDIFFIKNYQVFINQFSTVCNCFLLKSAYKSMIYKHFLTKNQPYNNESLDFLKKNLLYIYTINE